MAESSVRLYRAAALWWLLLFALAIVNGVAREAILSPLFGPAISLPLSGLTAMALFGVATRVFVARRPIMTVPQAWGVGLLWLTMTLASEYALFAGLMGRPASEVMASFSREAFLGGNLMILVLAFVAAAPRLFTALRSRGR